MDVSRRCESADVADPIVATPDRVKVRVEQFLVFDALDHADDTPCDVVVDTRELSGPPDYGNDRERAVRLHVQAMTLIGVDGAETLSSGEYIRAGQVPLQLLCDQLGRARPVDVRADSPAHTGNQLGKLGVGSGFRRSVCRSHAASLHPRIHYV